VSPFITPITSSTSSFTAQTLDDTRLNIDALGGFVRCRTAIASGYVDTTHTQARITSLSFGDTNGDALTNCSVGGPAAGTVDTDGITCTATTRAPWLLHVRAADNRRTDSWTGTINTTSSCTFIITGAIGSCRISVDAGQSIPVRYTNTRSRIELSTAADRASSLTVTITNISGCLIPPGSYTATFVGIYTITTDTPTDRRLGRTPTITAAS
jgi:hypothetical protein